MNKQQLSRAFTILITLFLTANLLAQNQQEGFIKTFKSKKDFSGTVESITQNAKEHGWVILGTKMMHNSLKNAGYTIKPVAIIEICNPKYAGTILSQDETRMFSALMPCRISVYEMEEGKVEIAMLNSYLAKDMYDGFDLTMLLKATADMENMVKP